MPAFGLAPGKTALASIGRDPNLVPPSLRGSRHAKRSPRHAAPAADRSRPGRADARYLLGVDGGATKTLAAVLDLEAGTLHVGHGGPSNEDAVGAKAAVEALLDAADEAIDGAGIERARPRRGGRRRRRHRHGLDRRATCTRPAEEVGSSSTTSSARGRRSNGGGPGVAAIAGTGSNVFGVGAEGRSWRTGGWGHLLGDEGSGYWLGVESIRAALRDRDGSGPPTGLGEVACAFFECDDVEAAGHASSTRSP